MKRQTSTRGFTLLELSTAMFVMTLGVSGALFSFYRGFENVRAIQESRIAMRAIENEIEALRALPFEALQTGEAQAFRSATPECKRLVNVQRSVSIAPHDALPESLRVVRVELGWTGEHGRTIRKSAWTLIARRR